MQIWSHRGEHIQAPQNSPKSVSLASAHGFSGVEIDVFYKEGSGFVVSHDYPFIPVDGRLIMLEDVVFGQGDHFFFWLDLKNLHGDNVKKIRKALNQVLEREPGLHKRVFIESANGPALRRLNADFNCIYWVQFKREGLRGALKLLSIKFLMAVSDFAGITTDHRYIDEAFSKHFKHKCWFVFTVNSAEELRYLKTIEEVQVVLTDLPFEEIRDVVAADQ